MAFASHTMSQEQIYQDQLTKRNITASDEKLLGLELLKPEDTAKVLGFGDFWSIKIPYYDVNGQPAPFTRVRVLSPNTKMKYSQPRASGSHIYFPPINHWPQILNDVTKPLIITEGEFKAWAITKYCNQHSLDYSCIGLAGVTSWRDKSGAPLHKDLMQIRWKQKTSFAETNRKVYIIFDYDGAMPNGEPNVQVALAESKLAVTLKGLGAEVHLCRVGQFGQGVGTKYAIDDHLNGGGGLAEVLTATSVVMSGADTLDVKLHDFSTKYAFINGDVIRLTDGYVMSYAKAKVDSAQNTFTITFQRPNGQPATKIVDMLDEYKRWSKRVDIKEIGIYPKWQGIKITPQSYYNLLNDWEAEPSMNTSNKYLEFCTYFFQDDPTFQDYWHDWVANIIQRPWKRNSTTPQFISGIEGIGKSAIAEFIAEMIGRNREGPALVMGPDEIFSSFNGHTKTKILLVINEPSSDRENHSAKLKNMITSDERHINEKYGHSFVIQNYVNFVFTSNKPFVTTMGNTARREAIYTPRSPDPQVVKTMVTDLMVWARTQDGFGAVLNFYLNRDISQFNPHAPAPMTDAKASAIQLSQSATQDFAQDLLQWVTDELDGTAFLTASNREILHKAWYGDENVPSAKYINRALSAMCDVESKVIKEGGKSIKTTAIYVHGKKAVDTINYGEKLRETNEAVLKVISDAGMAF